MFPIQQICIALSSPSALHSTFISSSLICSTQTIREVCTLRSLSKWFTKFVHVLYKACTRTLRSLYK